MAKALTITVVQHGPNFDITLAHESDKDPGQWKDLTLHEAQIVFRSMQEMYLRCQRGRGDLALTYIGNELLGPFF